MSNYSFLLILIGGLCWITVYAEAVRVSLRDKSYAIPFWAVGLNFSWEALHTYFAWSSEGPSLEVFITAIRGLLSVFVLFTWLRFGGRHFPENPGEGWFVPWSILVIAVSFALQNAFISEFGISQSRAYAAFLQNLAMSLLFIAMLARRKSRQAQSMTIAIAKWIGALAPTILFGVLGTDEFHGPNNLLLVLGILCSLFDLIYIALLMKATPYEKRRKSSSPKTIDQLELS